MNFAHSPTATINNESSEVRDDLKEALAPCVFAAFRVSTEPIFIASDFYIMFHRSTRALVYLNIEFIYQIRLRTTRLYPCQLMAFTLPLVCSPLK